MVQMLDKDNYKSKIPSEFISDLYTVYTFL